MTSLFEDVDYKNNVFEYPDLSRIIGEPTTATLITLHNEIKANAQSVHTTLGGGENGHLGLVCSPESYQTLVPGGTPYEKPANPGRLQIDGNETQYQIAQRKQEHDESTRLFREVLGVERSLIQQIVSAIEPKYLKALRNPITNKITKTIPEIFAYLFDTYGDVSPHELRMLTSQVEALTFPPNEPVDTIFTEIDELSTIAELANAPITEQQKINMGYLLLQKVQVYNTSLNKWDQFPVDEKSWENFKSHFRESQKSLRRTGALTIQDSINHTEILNIVQQGVQMALEEKSLTTITPSSNDITKESANSMASDLTLQTIQQQMELMKQMVVTMKSLQPPSTTQTRRSRRNPNQTKYCWTHGLCSHTGADCRTPAEGHIAHATLQIK